MSDDNGEKSFDPTPKRRKDFRKQGRFARAKDAGGTVGLAAVLGVLLGSRDAIGRAVHLLFARCHGDLGAVGRGDFDGVTQAAFGVLGALCIPPVLTAAIASTSVGIAQAGLHVNMDSLSLDLSRLNPLPRLKQLFSFKQSAVETTMNLLRVGVVGYVAYRALRMELPMVLQTSRVTIDVGVARLVEAAVRVILSALGALAVICAADYTQSWILLWREMKMTRKEVMDEAKGEDGDPKVKARMRARARALARKRALASVKTASVVVANPTHVSVALRYSPSDGAPVVIAKGHDDVALQIRAEARKYGIPILENRPLARALDAEVPVGAPIPVAHFAAVAKVLAFVFRIRNERRGMRRA